MTTLQGLSQRATPGPSSPAAGPATASTPTSSPTSSPSPSPGAAPTGKDGLPDGQVVPVPAAPPGAHGPAAGRIMGLAGQLVVPVVLGGFVLKSMFTTVGANGNHAGNRPRLPYLEHLVPRSVPGTAALAVATGAAAAWSLHSLLPDDGTFSSAHVRTGGAIAAGAVGALGGIAGLRANAIGQAVAVPHGVRVLAAGLALAGGLELTGLVLDRTDG